MDRAEATALECFVSPENPRRAFLFDRSFPPFMVDA